jgi:hypothetical protein
MPIVESLPHPALCATFSRGEKGHLDLASRANPSIVHRTEEDQYGCLRSARIAMAERRVSVVGLCVASAYCSWQPIGC